MVNHAKQKAKIVLSLIIFMIALDLISYCKYRKAKTKMQGFLFNLMCMVILSTFLSPIKNTQAANFDVQSIVSDLNNPWSIKSDAFSRYWITLMSGELVIVEQDSRQVVPLNLAELYQQGQGGLMDIVLVKVKHDDVQVIVSYAQGNAVANRLALNKIALNKVNSVWQITHQQQLFSVKDDKQTPVHYAGRLLLLPDDTLLVNSGDGFDYREDAQRVESQLGKTLRMTLDGKPVADAPFADDPYLYSLGHRNAQGLALDAIGQIWQHEHGPAGGDEVNLLMAGANYGWPIITEGKDYSGALISPIKQAEGMMSPKVNWTPSIAPSSMVYYRSDALPELSGSLLIGTLKTKTIHRIDLQNDFRETVLSLPINKRIRDITVDHQGRVLLLTDGENAQVFMLTQGQN